MQLDANPGDGGSCPDAAAPVTLEVAGSLAVVTLNRPHARNALDMASFRGLDAALDRARSLPDVRAVVLVGKGGRAFCAGIDLVGLARAEPAGVVEDLRYGQGVFERVADLHVPTIAAVDGIALGAGFELALACDFVVADAGASFGFPEVGRGITPGLGGTQRLPRAVGRTRALDLLVTGRRIGAEEALAWGLCARVCEEGQALRAALELGMEIARQAPLAVWAARRLALEAPSRGQADGLEWEARAFALCLASEDCREGLAAYLAKRPPVFRGR